MHPRSFKTVGNPFSHTRDHMLKGTQHSVSYSPLHKICHLMSTMRKQLMMMEYVYMGAFPAGGKAKAFRAGLFLVNLFSSIL